jgi:hypothetical protein
MDHDIVPVLAIVLIFGAPVAAWIVSRVLRHQERMEYLRRGMMPPPDVGGRNFRKWYREVNSTGNAGPAPGAPIPPPWQAGPVVPPPRGYSGDDDPQCALFKGIRISLIGLAILIGVSFIGGSPFHPGPLALAGLIPMFVGIAQIIIALLSGAQLPGLGRSTFFVPPPGPGYGPRPGPPPPQQPGAAWQPGDAWPWGQQPGRAHLEELSKPPAPPDTR